MTLTMKPIGTMKSLFQFKNGTPRQASICSNAPGILTIERSVFNNPEHSLEGLEDYSHAWIIFVFHKNNNSHTKAKVKPPRLDGKRTGVFSSRSPYRPNNIGLSLVKIDKIEGATVYLSGVDMIDGTPVLDIKPYIPEYDYPVSSVCDKIDDPHTLKKCDATQDDASKGLDSSVLESNTSINNNNSSKTSATDIKELEKGFLAMSSALDRAGDILTSKSKRGIQGAQSVGNELSHCHDSQSTKAVKIEEGETPEAERLQSERGDTDEDLDMFLETVLSQAVESLSVELPSEGNSLKPDKISKCVDAESISTPVNHSSATASKEKGISSTCKNQTNYDQDKSRKEPKPPKKPRELIENEKTSQAAYPVVAPWLLNPPVKKLRVTFTTEALQQLQHFSKSSPDPHYHLQLLSNAEEAESAIRGVLHEEPRSVYRRQHCQDSLYFFTVDIVHITCWFDEDVAQVVRVKPVATVSKLQHRLEGGIE